MGSVYEGHREYQIGILQSAEYFQRAGGNAEGLIPALYRDVLGRTAESAGIAGWKQPIENGHTIGEVACHFIHSTEYRQKKVDEIYVRALGRHAEPVGLSGWMNFLDTRGELLTSSYIFASEEYYRRQ